MICFKPMEKLKASSGTREANYVWNFNKLALRTWNRNLPHTWRKNKTLAYMILKKAEEFGDQDALIHKVKGQWVTIKWKDFAEQIGQWPKPSWGMGIQPGEMAGITTQPLTVQNESNADLGILATKGSIGSHLCPPILPKKRPTIVNDAGIKILFIGESRYSISGAKKVKAESLPGKNRPTFDPVTVTSGGDQRSV